MRAPNHLGDLVMALPALAAVPAADVIVPRGLAELMTLARDDGNIIPFERGRAGFIRAVRAVRRRNRRSGVLLTPSFSSALMLQLGGVGERRGSDTDRRRILLTDAVPLDRIRGRPRVLSYIELVTGSAPERPPAPSLQVTEELRETWWRIAGVPKQPIVGIFPGSNAPSRRWEPRRFAELAQALSADGHRVVVFGGPSELAITAEVAGAHAMDLGGRTSLAVLAAALGECQILVSNDSGPLHLAAAVGTRTLSLLGAGDPRETGVIGAAHTLLRHPELPCVPCVRNECPRRGAGYVLPEARLECLQLIAVPDVLSAARAMLQT